MHTQEHARSTPRNRNPRRGVIWAGEMTSMADTYAMPKSQNPGQSRDKRHEGTPNGDNKEDHMKQTQQEFTKNETTIPEHDRIVRDVSDTVERIVGHEVREVHARLARLEPTRREVATESAITMGGALFGAAIGAAIGAKLTSATAEDGTAIPRTEGGKSIIASSATAGAVLGGSVARFARNMLRAK